MGEGQGEGFTLAHFLQTLLELKERAHTMQKEIQATVTAYDVLGLDLNADQKQIHAALRKLARDWHPDRVPEWRKTEATLRFQAIMDAYSKLRTPEARAAYNNTLKNSKNRDIRKRMSANSNDNLPLAIRARAWLKAIETVFWSPRK